MRLATLLAAALLATAATAQPQRLAGPDTPDPQKAYDAQAQRMGVDLSVTWEGSPQWLEGASVLGNDVLGVLFGTQFLGGSSVSPSEAFPVQIVFSDALETRGQTFRPTGTTGTWSTVGVGTVPGEAYDISDPANPRRLNLVFAEASTPDFAWEPDGSVEGGREWLYVMASDYDSTGQAYAGASFLSGPLEDHVYIFQSRLVDGRSFLEADPSTLTIRPARIAGLEGTPNGSGVDLTWSYDAPPEVAGLRVYTGLTSPASDLLATLPPSRSSYTHAVGGIDLRYYRVEALSSGGEVVDISQETRARPTDAFNTTLLGQLDERGSYGDLWGYVDPATGREYALLTSRNEGLSIVDLDRATPTEVGFVPGITVGTFGVVADAKDIKTYRQYAYLAHEFKDILIVDLSDPASPQVAGRLDVQPSRPDGGSHNILVDGDYLYVVGGRDPGGLRIYHLADDPTDPPLVGQINGTDGQTYYHDLDIVGDIAYAAAIYDQGIDVLDLSDRTNPEVIETIIYPATYQGAHNVCATPDGETIFVGDEIGSGPWTRAFDVSDLSDPELIAELIVDDQAVVHNCYVEGDLLYVAHYTEGLQVFDVSTPASPEQVAFYDTRPGPGFGFDGAWTAYPYLPSGRVIVSDLSGGLFVIRADVGAARLSARATTPLAIAPGGAVSFDYTVANLQAGPLTGDLYFVAERNGTVVAQDLITSGTLPAGQTVGGTFTQPVSSDTPAGTYAYSLRVGQFPGVAVDLSTFPLVVGAAGAPAGAAEAWTVTDATPWSGEAPAVRSEAPSAAPSVAAFPNPFGDAVTLRFTLPEAAAVRLAVYDVLGREVAVLAEGPRAAGVHEAVLDGRGLAAGGYVWHLEAAGAVQTGRLVLTR